MGNNEFTITYNAYILIKSLLEALQKQGLIKVTVLPDEQQKLLLEDQPKLALGNGDDEPKIPLQDTPAVEDKPKFDMSPNLMSGGAPDCPSEGSYPVPLLKEKDFKIQSRKFHPDKNPVCIDDATDKFQTLQDLTEKFHEENANPLNDFPTNVTDATNDFPARNETGPNVLVTLTGDGLDFNDFKSQFTGGSLERHFNKSRRVLSLKRGEILKWLHT